MASGQWLWRGVAAIFKSKWLFLGFFTAVFIVLSLIPTIKQSWEEKDIQPFITAAGKLVFEHDNNLKVHTDRFLQDRSFSEGWQLAMSAWFFYVFLRIIYEVVKLRGSDKTGANLAIAVFVLIMFEIMYYALSWGTWHAPLQGVGHFVWNIGDIWSGANLMPLPDVNATEAATPALL